jgi:hypothetical protein
MDTDEMEERGSELGTWNSARRTKRVETRRTTEKKPKRSE